MAFLRKINLKAKTEINTGFGNNNSDYGGRFINKNGQPNIQKTGLSFFKRISWFHTLLQTSNSRFFSLIFLFYFSINFLFAAIYYFIGVEHLAGLNADSGMGKFAEAYFFSAQTFTTVGYGRISPVGFLTSTISSVEALLGLLSFAIATGLFYGRFSKPKAYLLFSNKAVLAPFKDGLAIMMKVAPFKNINLTDAEAKLSAGISLEENGNESIKFFLMDLEYSKINSLTLSWTIVHPINEVSPFHQFSAEDYKNIKGEIIVYVKAFDDMFSNIVVARTSYTLNEIIIGAKFVPIYYRNETSNKTILDLGKLNETVPVNISHLLSTNGKQ